MKGVMIGNAVTLAFDKIENSNTSRTFQMVNLQIEVCCIYTVGEMKYEVSFIMFQTCILIF